jgi:hypothetical protein
MKRFIISTVIAVGTACAAFAEPVTVKVPADLGSAELVAAYVAKLNSAITHVCYKAAAPVMGPNYWAYLACLKATRADVAAKDPTGLYAQRGSAHGTAIAAR